MFSIFYSFKHLVYSVIMHNLPLFVFYYHKEENDDIDVPNIRQLSVQYEKSCVNVWVNSEDLE